MSVACRFVCDAAKETELYSFSLKPKRNDPSLSDEFVALILSHPKISPLPRPIYIKEHGGGDELAGRSLFVDEIPPDWQESDLTELFSAFGQVESAVMHTSRMSGMVVFNSEESVEAALALGRRGGAMTYCPRWARGAESGPAVVGLRRRLGDHLAEKAPDQSKLEERINAWFEANEERKARLAEEKRAAMEEDGWTMVTSSKGRKRARDEEGGVAVGAVTLGRAQATKAKRKEAVLQDFYRFQQREKRRGELLELREKFERDKQKVLHVKGERRFLK